MDILFKNYRYFFDSYFLISPVVFLGVYSLFLMFFLYINRYFFVKVKWILIFALYSTLVVDVTLLCEHRSNVFGIILNPLQGVTQIIIHNNVHILRAMVSNIILFLPLGMILFYSYKIKETNIILLISFMTSATIEVLQMSFKIGYFETQDILCNVMGSILGVFIVKIILYMRKRIIPW